jgi:predicted DNA-binding transcriptional regulator YafY
MDLFDRIFQVHRILRAARGPVSRATLQERLECSRATVGRVIEEMRDFLGAPIEYDRGARGYRYAADDGPYELPGLWFNASELHSLLAAHQLLASAQPGLLEGDLAPLLARIERILAARGLKRGETGRRVRILRMAARRLDPEPFRTVAGAVLARRRLRLVYHGRARDAVTDRIVSPQRLTHYRDNWYLDAWDHGRAALRSFSVDRVLKAQALDTAAKDVPEGRLDGYFASSYGIFAGKARNTAVLRFGATSARWVADELWHPDQKGTLHDDGHYVLEVPYGDSRELVRDILQHGPEVTVVSPPALRDEVLWCLREAQRNYERARGVAD